VNQDLEKAVHLFTLAANQGCAQAQYNLAYMYVNAQGVNQDYKEAVRLYTLAANQGEAKAQYKLAMMYHKGWGVEEDCLMAVKYFTECVSQKGDVKECAKRGLSKLVTFTADTSQETAADEEERIRLLSFFHDKLETIGVKMHNMRLRHPDDPSYPSPPSEIFSLKALGPLYTSILDLAGEMTGWGEQLLKDRPFLVTCVQPTSDLLSRYKANSLGEQKEFCRVVVKEQPYYCMRGNAPQLGCDFRAFLEKSRTTTAFNELRDKLQVAYDQALEFDRIARIPRTIVIQGVAYEGVSFSHQPQIDQFKEELELVDECLKAFNAGLEIIERWVEERAPLRNKAFWDENRELFE
jgi:hypothetical protein